MKKLGEKDKKSEKKKESKKKGTSVSSVKKKKTVKKASKKASVKQVKKVTSQKKKVSSDLSKPPKVKEDSVALKKTSKIQESSKPKKLTEPKKPLKTHPKAQKAHQKFSKTPKFSKFKKNLNQPEKAQKTQTPSSSKERFFEIKLRKSLIGASKEQKAGLTCLKLSKRGQKRIFKDTLALRGQIFKLQHFLELKPLDSLNQEFYQKKLSSDQSQKQTSQRKKTKFSLEETKGIKGTRKIKELGETRKKRFKSKNKNNDHLEKSLSLREGLLHQLRSPFSRFKKKRLGRGDASGHGGTSSKGHKGQKSRSGGKIRRGFEGGQTPLTRRLPKFGFKNRRFKKDYETFLLKKLESLALLKVETAKSVKEKMFFKFYHDESNPNKNEITPFLLQKSGFIKSKKPLKILLSKKHHKNKHEDKNKGEDKGKGKNKNQFLQTSLKVKAHKFSASAKEAIEVAGGVAEVIS